MSFCTINGVEAVSADIYLPRVGVWHADFVLDQSISKGFANGSRVAILAANGAMSFSGTVCRSGVARGTLFIQVMGGGGGLSTQLPPRAYQALTLRQPLIEILGACKETLSPLSSPDVLAQVLNKWARTAQNGGSAVASLVSAAGPDVAWRILNNGTFWIGRELWRLNPLEYSLVQEEPTLERFRLAADVPDVKPGDMLSGGQKVSYVEHHWDGGSLRTTVWTGDSADLDPVKRGLVATVRGVFPQMDFLGSYPSKVVVQHSDGTLDLIPDDPTIPHHQNVPIRYGVPGVSATVATGARVHLEFANGDPRYPVASLWEAASVTKLTVNATEIDLGAGTTAIALATAAFKTWLAAHTHTGVLTGGGTSGPPTVDGSIGISSTTVKAS